MPHPHPIDPALEGRIVGSRGRIPCRVMLIGEQPGETEARTGRPFVGRSGKELDMYLGREGGTSHEFYVTNLNKRYHIGNPDPTPAEVREWGPVLLEEVSRVRPRFIIAAGAFAARFLLGPDLSLDAVHGMPFAWAVDPSVTVIPCFHPAAGFYDDDIRTLLMYDYSRAMRMIRGRLPAQPVIDEFDGREEYLDVSGDQLHWVLDAPTGEPAMGLDTEGVPRDPWSVQISLAPGTGLVLRRERPDFAVGIAALQRHVLREDVVTVMHNGMYDIEMCRAMGLDLFDARIFDTMYAAYIMRTQPQGLKALARRWCGMQMRDYSEVVGDIGREKQLTYLMRVMDEDWPLPQPRVEYENDGTFHLYKPQRIAVIAEKIVIDVVNGKTTKEGPTDPLKRWKDADPVQRRMVESRLGRMPIGTLADIDLDSAIRYSARDPDATLRLYSRLLPDLESARLLELMNGGMEVLPIFEEMQSGGMPAERRAFEDLRDAMQVEMNRLGARISHRYYGGKPFNPGSSDQVAAVIRRRGLTPEKKTKTGNISTAKKSIEHLRYEDDAMADIINWREHAKIRDGFCKPIIESMGNEEVGFVRTQIKITRTATRRLASGGIPLLAIPVRHKLGVMVRKGFRAPAGYVLGSWDLSQIEMRYMAHVSRDPLLHHFFNNPKLDMHAETAARIFGLKVHTRAATKEEMYAEVDEMQHRYPAKRAGFGIITNIMGPGLLDQLRMFGCKGWDVDRCDKLIAEWLKVYKGVADYLEACKAEVRRKGVIYDHWGMPRYLPGVWSDDRKTRAEAERAASSHRIQGGAQGMIQRAMAWLRPYIRGLRLAGEDIRWVLQIHDEVILAFRRDSWDMVDPLVREGLTEHCGIELSVPVKCSGAMAEDWGEL